MSKRRRSKLKGPDIAAVLADAIVLDVDFAHWWDHVSILVESTEMKGANVRIDFYGVSQFAFDVETPEPLPRRWTVYSHTLEQQSNERLLVELWGGEKDPRLRLVCHRVHAAQQR